MYFKGEALNVLGCLCNNLNLLRDKKYNLTEKDFKNYFHSFLFVALKNLSIERELNRVDVVTLDNYISQDPVKYERYQQEGGIEFIRILKETSNRESFELSYNTLKKCSLLTSYQQAGMDISKYYLENDSDLEKVELASQFFKNSSLKNIMDDYKAKLLNLNKEFDNENGDYYNFKASDGIDELLENCNKKTQYGSSFQSKYLNTIFRGMQGSKFFVRSSNSGGGKTRQALGDIVSICCREVYDSYTNKWVINNNPEKALFISTELTKDEVQLILIAAISGVNEEIIKEGFSAFKDLNAQTYATRVNKAKEILKEANIYCEYISDFSISDLENIIESNIINNHVDFVFFDYMQITPRLASELNAKFGYTLREDQMLNQLSTALKNLANKHDIFLASSTQLNRNYKHDSILDTTHLRGGMATGDKCDWIIITQKITAEEKEKLQPIIEQNNLKMPTHGHHIIKNRGGKWVGVIVWVQMDLGTMSVKDCFVTTQTLNFVEDIVKTELS